LKSAAPLRILGLSGSLRTASLNTMVLRVAARIAPPTVTLEIHDGMGQLPLFNPDLEPSDPAPVAALRSRIIASDALVIASPEYAHGISGVLKNALDWMVGNESFVNKPVALFNTSPRASQAQAALREVLCTMSARIIEEACVAIPLLGSGLSDTGILQNREMTSAVIAALRALESVGCASYANP
jgi:chromate reductase, NAD(P)H dehydrogenase (quinone)